MTSSLVASLVMIVMANYIGWFLQLNKRILIETINLGEHALAFTSDNFVCMYVINRLRQCACVSAQRANVAGLAAPQCSVFF